MHIDELSLSRVRMYLANLVCMYGNFLVWYFHNAF